MSLQQVLEIGGNKLPLAPEHAAKEAGLRYISNATPGFRREKSGSGFRFLDTRGRPLQDEDHLRRIKSLAIPPAWTNVWICPSPDGHLQATGHDARGRKQYRYHPRWRSTRDDVKFARMIAFAQALPKIRKRVAADLREKGLTRNRVLATIVKLLELSLIRVGNEEYARNNHSFGLTTMRDQHVQVTRERVRFQFRGKSGKFHNVDISDPLLARVVNRCQDLPGQELFQYIDEDGRQQDVKSEDVNAYLRTMTGQDFTAKDFRTWAGTVLAARALRAFEKFATKSQAKKNLLRAIEAVAQKLGNTPTICRRCYVHPAIMDAYMEGGLVHTLRQRANAQSRDHKLRPEEAAVLKLLQARLAEEADPKRLEKQLAASLRYHRKSRAR
jgi:DNA topoisomerase-1